MRLADVLAEWQLKPSSPRCQAKPQGLAPVTGNPSDRITMDALYPRYAAFLRPGDTVVIETGSTSLGIHVDNTARRRQTGGTGSMGINRLGDGGCARRGPCRSGSAHGSDHRRRFPPADRKRYRRHGTIRSKRHCLRAQQQRLPYRARTRREPGLDLQRPRALEVR